MVSKAARQTVARTSLERRQDVCADWPGGGLAIRLQSHNHSANGQNISKAGR